MPQNATIENLEQAMKMVKEMGLVADPAECSRQDAMRMAIKGVLEAEMRGAVDRHMEEMGRREAADRRNGAYARHLLTSMGDIEVMVPRTRSFSAHRVLGAYARRAPDVDRLILATFVLGLSTRKVGVALQGILGERVSATTVSRVARALDAAVAAFHQRRLDDGYRFLFLDGVVLKHRTGAGALKRPVLVALGIRRDGRKEVIDFHVAKSESANEWETFLTSLYKRGLQGKTLEMVSVDGGQGTLAALRMVYPSVPLQRCWAHKARNITDKVRRKDRVAVKEGLRKIYNAKTLPKAQAAARRFANKWELPYPKAVSCLRRDLDELLTCFRLRFHDDRRAVRTTNYIERRFREVRRRTRPMSTFADSTSIDRILYAVFTHQDWPSNSTTPVTLH